MHIHFKTRLKCSRMQNFIPRLRKCNILALASEELENGMHMLGFVRPLRLHIHPIVRPGERGHRSHSPLERRGASTRTWGAFFGADLLLLFRIRVGRGQYLKKVLNFSLHSSDNRVIDRFQLIFSFFNDDVVVKFI